MHIIQQIFNFLFIETRMLEIATFISNNDIYLIKYHNNKTLDYYCWIYCNTMWKKS